MYPHPFEYVRPESLAEAVELLAAHGDGARPLAGGMSLIPLMKLRLAAPSHVVDIGRLPELAGLGRQDGALVLGANVRHAEVAGDERLGGDFPLLADMAPEIGDVQVRNRGTVGGSLAEADPSGDWGPAALALRALIVCHGPSGERTIGADDFFRGPYETALEPGELVTAVRVPLPAARSGGAHLKLERRSGDFGVAIASVQIELDDEGRCRAAGVGLGAVSLMPLRAAGAERTLLGERPEGEALRAAVDEVRRAAVEAEPVSDVKAPAAYRRDVIQALFRRAVERAAARATEQRQGGDR